MGCWPLEKVLLREVWGQDGEVRGEGRKVREPARICARGVRRAQGAHRHEVCKAWWERLNADRGGLLKSCSEGPDPPLDVRSRGETPSPLAGYASPVGNS